MSKISIKVGKPEYIIKPEEGVVICKIKTKGNITDFYTLIQTYDLSAKIKKQFRIKSVNEELFFTAVTKLHEGDTWDEIKGKRIAESKCKQKIYKFYHRLYSFIINYILHNSIKPFINYTYNIGNCINTEEKHFKELIK